MLLDLLEAGDGVPRTERVVWGKDAREHQLPWGVRSAHHCDVILHPQDCDAYWETTKIGSVSSGYFGGADFFELHLQTLGG